MIMVGLFCSCASGPVNPDLIREESQVAEAGKHLKEGEPVESTSMAIFLAELALKEKGVDFGDRNVTVSFCDGVYTVVFEKKPEQVTACDYLVQIEAASSRIVKVVTDTR